MRFGPSEPLQSMMMLLGCGSSGAGGPALDPPVNTVAPVISGTAQEGETLAISDGTWTGLAPMVFTYQLARFDASSVFVEDIAGATNNTYVTTAGDIGYKVGCYVTGTNDDGNSEVLSNLTAVVATAPIEFPATFETGVLKWRAMGDNTAGTSGDIITAIANMIANGDLVAAGDVKIRDAGPNGHRYYEFDGALARAQGQLSSSAGSNYFRGIVLQWPDTYAAQSVAADGFTSGYGGGQFQGAIYRTGTNQGYAFYNGNAPIVAPGGGPETTVWAYVGVRVNGSAITIEVNTNAVQSGTGSVAALLGITLGADGTYGGAQRAKVNIAEDFVVATPSANDKTALDEYVMPTYAFGAPPDATAQVACAGDSNSFGAVPNPAADSYPSQLQVLFNTSRPGTYVTKFATSGWTWLDFDSQLASFQATLQGAIDVTVVIQLGLNDWDGGANAATVISRAAASTAAVLALTEVDRVVLLTPLATETLDGSDLDTVCAGYLALADTNLHVIDQRTDAPLIGDTGAWSNATYFNSAESPIKHLTVAGCTVQAETVETATLPLMP